VLLEPAARHAVHPIPTLKKPQSDRTLLWKQKRNTRYQTRPQFILHLYLALVSQSSQSLLTLFLSPLSSLSTQSAWQTELL
jgi:hypothetical protein